jgi:hypothetical protein
MTSLIETNRQPVELSMMQHQPEISFRYGPLPLQSFRRSDQQLLASCSTIDSAFHMRTIGRIIKVRRCYAHLLNKVETNRYQLRSHHSYAT